VDFDAGVTATGRARSYSMMRTCAARAHRHLPGRPASTRTRWNRRTVSTP